MEVGERTIWGHCLVDRSTAEKRLDTVFSKWIRLSAADESGTVKCVTCGKLMFWRGDGAQAGHFVKRQHRLVRFDERNVHVQCVHCNKYLDGNQDSYAVFIADRYGLATLKELEAAKRVSHKWLTHELVARLEAYKAAVKPLEKRFAA
jgi:hypothetical protein